MDKIYIKFIVQQQNIEKIEKIRIAGGKVGKNVKFGLNVMISGYENLNIGDNVHIGTGSFIRAEGGLTIGSNTIISRNVVIYTSSHNYDGNRIPFDDTHIYRKVDIEENVWIGMNVTISPGTKIREGSIIALGTSVYGDIPKCSIVGNYGWKTIKTRDRVLYNSNKKNNKFSKENGLPY